MYSGDIMAGISMGHTSAFLIHPNANPGGHGNGILAPHRCGGSHHAQGSFMPDLSNPPPHTFTLPGLSGGLSGGMESVSTASGPSTSPRQQPPSSSQSSNLHHRRPVKRPLADAMADAVQLPDDYSSPALRGECLFPPDNINEGKGMEQKLKLGPGHGLIGMGGGGGGGDVGNMSAQLKWQAHMVDSWLELCDAVLQDIPTIGFKVETDKGFNFSVADDSFVCQKKNHFQVTVAIAYSAIPKFVKMKDGNLKPIEKFSIYLHGVKFEQINCEIKLEQSKSDRTKNKFEPELIDVTCFNGEPIKRTMCRMHYSETTQNNMRKRGKPNPDQKYFSLVVSLHADTADGSYPVVAHVSERIIVRASNPGNFDNDCDYSWFKSSNTDSIYHHGRVGINTDKPDEALSIHGNLQITGQILQASDKRIKRNIRKFTSEGQSHLDKLLRLQLYEYQLAPTSSMPSAAGINGCTQTDVLDASSKDTRWLAGYPGKSTSCGATTKRSVNNSAKTVASAIGRSTSCEALSSATGKATPEGLSEDLCKHLSVGPCVEELDNCLRDDATGILCQTGSHGKSCDDHVTCVRSGAKEDGRVRGDRRIVGLIAQEVQKVLPNAVMETSQEVTLANGDVVKHLLVVDKDQVLMETIGAVQDLHATMLSYEDRLRECQEAISRAATKEILSGFALQVYQEPSKSTLHKNLRISINVSLSYVLIFILALLLFSFIFFCLY